MTKWIFALVLSILLQGYNTEKTADEILNNLVSYDHRIPPTGTKGPGSPVEVTVSMYILDLKVDDIKEEMTAQMYFRQTWKDPRLEFKDGEVKEKLLEQQDWGRIWNADLFFVEESKGKLHTVPFSNTFSRWTSDGTVFMSMRLSMTFRCNMDMSYYPHDQHKCSFFIESFAHKANKVSIDWVPEKDNTSVSINDKHHEKNFHVINLHYRKEIEEFQFGNYSRLVVDITLQRNPGFFVTKLYIPFIVLIIVSWLSLWINPRFVALRLSLLLSVLLAMFLIALDMNGYVPRVTYTKGIDVWTAFCISFAFALLLEFVFLAQKSEKEEVQELSHISTDTAPLENAEKDSKFLPLKLKIFHPTGGRRVLHYKADYAMRFIYPGLFGAFNLIYWSVYAS